MKPPTVAELTWEPHAYGDAVGSAASTPAFENGYAVTIFKFGPAYNRTYGDYEAVVARWTGERWKLVGTPHMRLTVEQVNDLIARVEARTTI